MFWFNFTERNTALTQRGCSIYTLSLLGLQQNDLKKTKINYLAGNRSTGTHSNVVATKYVELH